MQQPQIAHDSNIQPTITPMPKPKKLIDLRFFFLFLILIGIGGGIWSITKQPVQFINTPTPSSSPTPTYITKPTIQIATQSAFTEIIQSIASLSASIPTTQITDTTLSPPTIELPLGFPNE